MSNVARPLRGLVPVLAAFAAATAAALPSAAAVAPVTSPAAVPASEWWLTALHVPAALRAAPAEGKGVTVAVLSTGVDASHPDLAGVVTTGPDLSGTGRKRGSPYWGAEGTAVASLIAGHGHGPGAAMGITGVAPGARILSLQVTLEYSDPLASDAAITQHLPEAIAAGIRWAVGHGATVIALPLDPGTFGPAASGNPATGGGAAERTAVSFALAHGVLLVAPAGDNGAEGNSASYPAAYPGVIAVSATMRDGQLSPFSNTRSYVTLAAPGAGTMPDPTVSGGMTADPAAGLTVAAPGGGYQPLASTDISAALTAGVAALIRSRYPWLTAPEVTQALERGATAPPGGARSARGGPAEAGWGHGELDAAAALSSAAAVAAAHPAPVPSTATAASTRPAGAMPARHVAAASPSDPGHLLRSLVVDLAAAAGVLIACLAAAIMLTGRRRARTARSAGRARHAKGQPGPPTAPIPARVVIWPATPATPGLPDGSSGSTWLGAASTASDPSQAPGALGRPGATHRRPQPHGNPPWQPAPPPRDPASPPAMLPAQTAADKPRPPLAPWEESPEEFAVAPITDDFTPWPISNTGPMYVWNPATATSPMIAISGDQANEIEDKNAGED